MGTAEPHACCWCHFVGRCCRAVRPGAWPERVAATSRRRLDWLSIATVARLNSMRRTDTRSSPCSNNAPSGLLRCGILFAPAKSIQPWNRRRLELSNHSPRLTAPATAPVERQESDDTRYQLVFRKDGENDRSEYRYSNGVGGPHINGKRILDGETYAIPRCRMAPSQRQCRRRDAAVPLHACRRTDQLSFAGLPVGQVHPRPTSVRPPCEDSCSEERRRHS